MGNLESFAYKIMDQLQFFSYIEFYFAYEHRSERTPFWLPLYFILSSAQIPLRF